METEEREPEKEALVFDFNSDGLEPEMVEVMNSIKELAEKILYHWKTFPIALPPSITESQADHSSEDKGVISFKDLFIAPTFDELEEVSTDSNGDAKKLTEKQLKSVRETGEFEVESINFPGQVHRWRLTQLLQKGTKRSRDTLLNDTALALRILIITARNRFISHFFSLSESLKGLCTGLWQLLDIAVGMPSTSPGELARKIREEHTRFLVAELDIKPSAHRDWTTFCEYVGEKSKQLETERQRTVDLRPPVVPYRYQTPKGTEIDLRLFSKDLMTKCDKILKEILERESKGWHLQFKERLIQALRGQELSRDQIVESVKKSIMEEYLRRVYDAISNSESLENLQPGIGRLLVQQAKSVLLMEKAVDNIKVKLTKHREELKNHLVKTYPVRSRIKAWMNEKLKAFEEEFIKQHQWVAHEEAIEMCRSQGLEQTVYFLHRDLIFRRDREPVLRKELGKVKIANRVFTFSSRIWLPRNWIVHKNLQGESEVIPTVIVNSPTVIATPRTDPNQPSFTVEKYTRRKTSTKYPFWRWLNYIHRTWSWTWNTMFLLGVVIPWSSPVSLRALFFWNAFMPDLQLSQVNGSLCPRQSSLTHTLVSRLRSLWRHIRLSRTRFEGEPDTGFLGKSFTRHLNRFWNYVLKGAMGSFLLVTVFPVVCLIVSPASLLVALTTPVWIPVVTLIVHLSAFLIYDFDHPTESNAVMYLCEAIIWRLLCLGCLQPVAALITGAICCPVSSFFVMLFGIIRRGLRAMWDYVLFNTVIKKRGRVPASDGFVARRISGPGLASNYLYQIKPEQALAALEARMELQELNAWKQATVSLLEKPKMAYREFVKQCFRPFSGRLNDEGKYKELDEEIKQIYSELKKQVDLRRQYLQTGLTPEVQSRIRLTDRELRLTLVQAVKLVEDFYPQRVLARLTIREAEFWENKNLEQGNWRGLTNQLFSEIFSSSFLSPLEEADTCFKLEVQHLDLERYLDMLKSAEVRDDLDSVRSIYTPQGDVDVDAPYLEPYRFNPTKLQVKYAEYRDPQRNRRRLPWKPPPMVLSDLEKMEIPSPIPHPAVIALVIYNRENDQDSINLEDAVIQRILHAAENVPYEDVRDPANVELDTE